MNQSVPNPFSLFFLLTLTSVFVGTILGLGIGLYGGAHGLDLINFITAFIPFWVITNGIGIYIVAYRHGKKEQKSNQQ